MTPWTSEELAKIGNAEELAIASRRPDGALRPFVTIWVVRSGRDLYVRSVNGRSGTWLRRALAAREGRIRAGGVERNMAFEEASPPGQCPCDRGLPREVRSVWAEHRQDGGVARGRRVDPEARASLVRVRTKRRAADRDLSADPS